jgi:glycosyltransferase involved in cell wall biosynthesis
MAIKSILNQTFTDFELLVLDNYSQDNTEAVVKDFHDNRIRYIKHKPMPISQSRNLGIKEARGAYVAFLDDDDEWLPNKLKAQLKIFEQGENNLALVYGGFIRIYPDGEEFLVSMPTLKGRILKELLYQDSFTGSASNPMIKKSVFNIIGGYNETLVTGEDWELYLRLAEKYWIDFTSEAVVRIRTHPGPRLGDKLKNAAELELLVLEMYKDIFVFDRRLQSYYFQKIGGKFIRTGDLREGRRYLRKAIHSFPVNLSVYFQYLFSYMGLSFYRFMHKKYRWSVFFKPGKNIKTR